MFADLNYEESLFNSFIALLILKQKQIIHMIKEHEDTCI
jgi:hypothetical protein